MHAPCIIDFISIYFNRIRWPPLTWAVRFWVLERHEWHIQNFQQARPEPECSRPLTSQDTGIAGFYKISQKNSRYWLEKGHKKNVVSGTSLRCWGCCSWNLRILQNFNLQTTFVSSSGLLGPVLTVTIRSIGKALSQRPYAMMTSEAFDLGGGTVSRGFWVTIGWHLWLGNHQQGFFLGLTWHRTWQKTNNLYQVQQNLQPFCCNHELIGLLRARVEGC